MNLRTNLNRSKQENNDKVSINHTHHGEQNRMAYEDVISNQFKSSPNQRKHDKANNDKVGDSKEEQRKLSIRKEIATSETNTTSITIDVAPLFSP